MASSSPHTANTFDIDAFVARIPTCTVHAGDRTFSYRERGTGTPIVLLHGIGSSAASWIHQIEALSDTFRVLAWDAPGYGESSPLRQSSPTAADYADALAALLDALSIERIVLVGHSLGALVAGSFAASRPDRVARLVLVNPAGGYGLADAKVREERLTSRLALMNTLGPNGMAEQRGHQLLGPTAAPDALAIVQWSMRRLRADGHEQAARMLASGRLTEDASRYAGPTLVLGGTADRITPEDGCRRIAASAPNSTYRSLAGLGHASYIEAPATVSALVREFATRHYPNH